MKNIPYKISFMIGWAYAFVLVIVVNLGLLALGVWVIIKVLQLMGVL